MDIGSKGPPRLSMWLPGCLLKLRSATKTFESLLDRWPHVTLAPWCSGYHYCASSFKKAWAQILRRLRSCSWRVGELRWWGWTMIPLGNKVEHLSSVNHNSKQFIFIDHVKKLHWSTLESHNRTYVLEGLSMHCGK